jgi:hypothetical protein
VIRTTPSRPGRRGDHTHFPTPFGNPSVFTAIPPNPEHVSTTADIVRIGLNYRFSWEPPPIVTKVSPFTK